MLTYHAHCKNVGCYVDLVATNSTLNSCCNCNFSQYFIGHHESSLESVAFLSSTRVVVSYCCGSIVHYAITGNKIRKRTVCSGRDSESGNPDASAGGGQGNVLWNMSMLLNNMLVGNEKEVIDVVVAAGIGGGLYDDRCFIAVVGSDAIFRLYSFNDCIDEFGSGCSVVLEPAIKDAKLDGMYTISNHWCVFVLCWGPFLL